MASKKRILVHTDAERLFKYLRQYFEYGVKQNIGNTSYHVRVVYLNEKIDQKNSTNFRYPLFLFHLYTEIEFATRELHLLQDNKDFYKESIGSLEIIDSKFDQSILQFSKSEDLFQHVDKTVIEKISEKWETDLLQDYQEELDDIKPKKKGKNKKRQLGKYIKTIEYPPRFQSIGHPGTPQSQILRELLWDKYAIEHWNMGETVKNICKGIYDNELGDIGINRLYNRMSKLRTLYPELGIINRRNFKEK